jgi:diguanylate cyclase (GGDEF)-like protein
MPAGRCIVFVLPGHRYVCALRRDEFALVLPETNGKAANGVALRICESLANDDKGPKVSVSVGVAVYPENGETIEKLLCEADSGLYERKQQRMSPANYRLTGNGQ